MVLTELIMTIAALVAGYLIALLILKKIGTAWTIHLIEQQQDKIINGRFDNWPLEKDRKEVNKLIDLQEKLKTYKSIKPGFFYRNNRRNLNKS